MAAEMVAGALLSSFLQVAFHRLSSPDFLDYFRGRKLNETLLRKLKVTLLVIDAVIDDAENKQIRNHKVKSWVDEVKDAAYEAEDLLDEIDTKVSIHKQLEAEVQTSNTSKVRKFFCAVVSSFDRKVEKRMKQVLDNLEHLASQKDVLGLREGSGVGVGLGRMSERSPTTSLVDEAEICGRNDEKEKIIEWLLSDNEIGNHPYSVNSVVAMGGMGKTTLAQLVYNDERMDSEFDIKAWVYVSEEFDVVRVTRTIFEAITLCNDDTKDKNILQLKLKEKLARRKFFLVLDDVWNENYLNWEDLQKPFNEGAKGSKIFVTSRSSKVAKTMRSIRIIHLDGLPEGDSWLLFSKHAFHGRNPGSNPDLEEIGRKLVQKCKGLPLALKTIGSLLYSKASYEEWNSILVSQTWDMSDQESNILPALRLSYYYLPSHLKRCFSYCSLFPKGYEFNKEHLLWLWMGESFLNYSRNHHSVKELVDYYFYELLSRSFFQYSKKNKEYFIMHDLVSDLAKYVSGEFCFKLDSEGTVMKTISEKVRHFSFLSKTVETCEQFEGLYKAKKLRTFLNTELYRQFTATAYVSSKMLGDILSKFQCLRILSLSYFDITMLSNSIGKLKHLRYLDLSYTKLIELPDSICFLYNLQTLKLRFCHSLVKLPSDLHKLINLQYLDIKGTQVQNMPMQLGKLKKLQVLTTFVAGKSDIQQLAELHLGGELSILELQNVVNPMDALAANLKSKIHLDNLMLGWNIDNGESEQERGVFEKLQPHKNVRELSIQHYGGTRFPDWFGDNSLQNLSSLKLHKCKYCLILPPLGLLLSLKKLLIVGFDSIMNIGDEFHRYRTSTIPFRSLEKLVFRDMKAWENWECKDISGAFPALQDLRILNCPKLKKQLPEQLPSLRSVYIQSCKQLKASVPIATAIHDLSVVECGVLQLEYIASTLENLHFSSSDLEGSSAESIKHTISRCCLKRLKIDACLNMEFPVHHCHEYLISLSICSSCESLRTFPLDLFPKLQRLSLWECHNLEMISVSEGHDHYVTSVTSLDIKDCPKFVAFPNGGFSAPKLDWCSLIGLENLKSLPEKMVTILPSLRSLTLRCCPQLQLFPEGGLPSNLVDLEILNCPRLECLPKEGLPSSMSRLSIIDCPLLEKRCQKQEGGEWEKITHIPCIQIDKDIKYKYQGQGKQPLRNETVKVNCW